MARTGFVYSPKMLLHDTGLGHPERPERLTAIIDAFAKAGIKPHGIPITPATREDLLRVHTAEYVDGVQHICATSGHYPDPETPMGPASWEAALLATGGTISACKAVLDGEVDNAFCAVRPPGHHAEIDRGMGFCIFNNVVIAARWMQQVAHVKRVAILDWDVHHGNGTQQETYDDPTVYYASLHQHPFYPGSGWPSDRGADGTNLNLQFRRGTTPEEWLDAFNKKVMPELERFNPEFLLISAGFDAHKHDTLGGLQLETSTYVYMTKRAKTLANGRVVSALEGGYNLDALGECAVAHFRALQEDRT